MVFQYKAIHTAQTESIRRFVWCVYVCAHIYICFSVVTGEMLGWITQAYCHLSFVLCKKSIMNHVYTPFKPFALYVLLHSFLRFCIKFHGGDTSYWKYTSTALFCSWLRPTFKVLPYPQHLLLPFFSSAGTGAFDAVSWIKVWSAWKLPQRVGGSFRLD